MILIPLLQNPDDQFAICFDITEAATYIRLDTGMDVAFGESQLVARSIQSAMAWVEDQCGQPIFSRDYYGLGASFCNAYLHSLNVTAVSKVEYQIAGSASWVTLDASQYSFWETGQIFFTDAARAISSVTRIRVSYTAGYPAGNVPASILQAVRLLISKWYNSRDDSKEEYPSQARNLISGYIMPKL